MLLPTQAIFPGLLKDAFQSELENLTAKNTLARLWAKDPSLWPAVAFQTESLKSNLHWLDLPDHLGPLLNRVVARAVQIEPAGFEDVVFITMGNSDLAARSVLRLPDARLGKRTFLLDTIDPDAVRAFVQLLRLEKTLFIFISKSGKNIPAALRIGCLVGASTGKKGRGIIPICGRRTQEMALSRQGCFAVFVSLSGKEEPELASRSSSLRQAGVPVVTIELNTHGDLAAELFKWEIATALACSQLGFNPFHNPDQRESRARSVQILERLATGKHSHVPTVRVREGAVELFAEGETRQQISTLSMSKALRTFFGLRHRHGYIALLPFFNLGEVQKQTLRRIRDRLESALGLPALLTPGPRYLQSIGQVYLGGPPKGLFLVLTAAPAKDLAIPGADYSFGQLQLALALSEFESLGHRRSPVIRLHLSSGAERGLAELEAILTNALGKSCIVPP